jgi:uncharacterized lipoprotein YbaY
MRRRCKLVAACVTAALLAACAEVNNGLSPTTPIAAALPAVAAANLYVANNHREGSHFSLPRA